MVAGLVLDCVHGCCGVGGVGCLLWMLGGCDCSDFASAWCVGEVFLLLALYCFYFDCLLLCLLVGVLSVAFWFVWVDVGVVRVIGCL